ncbi:hypothetical protein GYH30_054825 [Glycine max]|uniref:Uncharacterized protein n=1 Tax=Glycine max TaxID=3847 RepID=A0A0R0E7J3_SOYBN|nr:hypothetical protein GYH30_054825 [Glycine max]
MVEAAKPINNVDTSNPMSSIATFTKPLPDISKIEVFIGQNFCRWQECVHTIWTCMELSSLFPLLNLMSLMMPVNFNNGFKPIRKRQQVQINEYHKLLEDLKTENISLPDEFISELLIEKLLES